MSINTVYNKILNQSAIEIVHWPVQNVLAMQTTRLTPFQNPPPNLLECYQFFNLGLHVGDDITTVENNRQQLLSLFPQNKKIQWFEQIHGNDVVEIIKACHTPIVADAAITKSKNVILAIMTADCLPILISNKLGDEIAAIHGGWKSLASQIISKTVEKMLSKNDELFAWLGPCISANAFEVGEDVKAKFIYQHKNFSTAFKSNGANKYLANLPLIATIQLQRLGIKNISKLSECTFSQQEKYFSYRKQQRTGRMATLISIL